MGQGKGSKKDIEQPGRKHGGEIAATERGKWGGTENERRHNSPLGKKPGAQNGLSTLSSGER